MDSIHLAAPPPFLGSPGDPPISWERWFSSFRTYLIASGLDGTSVSDARSRAILIHCLGTEGQRIFAQFSAADTYNDAVKALKQYFEPRKSVLIELYRFRQRSQGHGEPVKQFVAALTDLVSTCNFESFCDELVRDQLSEKTANPRIRECLLMEDDKLELKRALDLAIQVEAAMNDAFCKVLKTHANAPPVATHSQTSHSDPTSQVQGVQRKPRQSKQPSKQCGNCGHFHQPRSCPAFGKTCDSCKKLHHFASVCRSKRQKKQAPVRQLDETEYDEPSKVFTIGDTRTNPPQVGNFKQCELDIAGHSVSVLIHVGAKVSILSADLYTTLFANHPLTPAIGRLLAYGHSTIPVLGMVTVPVAYKDVTLDSFTFYVTKGKSLMGVDLFDALGFRLQDSTGAHIHLVESDIKAQYPTLFDGFVRRKNGELRLCIDLKEVNKAIIPDKYPLPTINELSASFHGAGIFTKLDMRRSYLQVPLAPESRHLTAFMTHEGVFQYRSMPYGLSSAPSAFQKIVSSVLSGIPGVLNLLDDVVVCGATTEEHDRRLHKVLSRLAKHRFTLNEEKCKFAASEIDFMGYRVTAEGVMPTQDNAAAIQLLPTPTNVKELASFLGTTNFYLKFVPRYAETAEPLHKLLRKDTPWEWNAVHESAFSELKRKIVSPQILTHFDPNATTFVTTDASNRAVGAVLSQEINGSEQPVAFASYTLTDTERKYSTREREAHACIFTREHWHNYVFGRKFTLRTDHQALTTLLATSGSGHKPLRIYRLSDRLHQYNFDVEYLAGSHNHVADMLSRTRTADSDNAEKPSRETEEYVNAVMSNAAKLVTRSELRIAERRCTPTRERHNLTARYNPQSNGGVERFNRVIEDSLKASLSEGKDIRVGNPHPTPRLPVDTTCTDRQNTS
ncbi:uncharacterized protein [Diadema setosum]|uniref:uncharacterized protein n=1 Tax=Diadema setosum TaxID=31175 RepID=UPI003B3A63C4